MMCEKCVEMEKNLIVPKKQYTENQKSIRGATIEVYEETIDYKYDDVIKKIKEIVNKNNGSYAIMRHDDDYYTENTFDKNHRMIGKKGDKKKTHYHINIWISKRIGLNDLCLAIGIEDRWIKILKKEYDFDNMIIYCTHLLHPEKTYYEPSKYDTNIAEYIDYVCEHAERNIVDENNHILKYWKEFELTHPEYITYKNFVYSYLNECEMYNTGLDIKELRLYFNVIKEMVKEHNDEKRNDDLVLLARDRAKKEIKNAKQDKYEKISKLCDTFGATYIEIDGQKYFISKVKNGEAIDID